MGGDLRAAGADQVLAFLPSRLDSRVPVPNRYFGVFQDGSIKVQEGQKMTDGEILGFNWFVAGVDGKIGQ